MAELPLTTVLSPHSDVTDSKSQQGTSLVCCILTSKGKDIQSNSSKQALCFPSPPLLEIALCLCNISINIVCLFSQLACSMRRWNNWRYCRQWVVVPLFSLLLCLWMIPLGYSPIQLYVPYTMATETATHSLRARLQRSKYCSVLGSSYGIVTSSSVLFLTRPWHIILA